MITNKLPLKSLSLSLSGVLTKRETTPGYLNIRSHKNNFVADIISKFLLPLFVNFYSPLK